MTAPPGAGQTSEAQSSRLCVVVGATGAIGSAVVRRSVGRGMHVVAVARSAEALAALAAELTGVLPCVADIATDGAVDVIGAVVVTIGGPVRMAVFVAGLPLRGSAETIDPQLLADGMNIKVGGLLRLERAVRDRMVRGSRLVAFAGSLGLEPRATEAGPGAVNAAVFHMMRQLSLILGPRGVTTHTIAPGPADTPRLRRIVEAVGSNSASERPAVGSARAVGSPAGARSPGPTR